MFDGEMPALGVVSSTEIGVKDFLVEAKKSVFGVNDLVTKCSTPSFVPPIDWEEKANEEMKKAIAIGAKRGIIDLPNGNKLYIAESNDGLQLIKGHKYGDIGVYFFNSTVDKETSLIMIYEWNGNYWGSNIVSPETVKTIDTCTKFLIANGYSVSKEDLDNKNSYIEECEVHTKELCLIAQNQYDLGYEEGFEKGTNHTLENSEFDNEIFYDHLEMMFEDGDQLSVGPVNIFVNKNIDSKEWTEVQQPDGRVYYFIEGNNPDFLLTEVKDCDIIISKAGDLWNLNEDGDGFETIDR